jgi:hypothetical protein
VPLSTHVAATQKPCSGSPITSEWPM